MSAPRQWCIPAEPIRRVAAEWLAEQERDIFDAAHGRYPERMLALEVWGDEENGRRMLYSLLNSAYLTIDFDTADKILCVTEKVRYWFTDPELREIYQQVPLPALDLVRPVNKRVGQQMNEYVAELFRRLGSLQAVRDATGFSIASIRSAIVACGLKPTVGGGNHRKPVTA